MRDPYESDREDNAVSEPDPEQECISCGHPIRLHGDKYGCQYERGDAWVTGRDGTECLMAQGPCGCKDWGFEEVEPDRLQRALAAYHLLEATREYATQDTFLIDALKRNGVL